MAELKPENGPIMKGSILPVTIEDVIADVLVVCLEHGAKLYKGILLDSTKRDMPYGLGFERFRLEAERKDALSGGETAVVDPNVGEVLEAGCHAEVTALSHRHTYCQHPDSTDPRLLPPRRKQLQSKPIRDSKNVRNMRLRPRKVLCSNCKQGIHENKVEGNTTSEATAAPAERPTRPADPAPLVVPAAPARSYTPDSGDRAAAALYVNQNQMKTGLKTLRVNLNRSRVIQPIPPRPPTTLKMSLRGTCKREVDREDRVVPTTPEPEHESPKRPRHESILTKISRASPVIKISFTSPQGEVHTSKLQTSRPTETDETEPESSPHPKPETQESFNYKRLKRALKKAKIKERSTWEVNNQHDMPEVTTTVPDENSIRHHKKSKRNKHKRKHRHRPLTIQSPIHDPMFLKKNDTSDFENDAANAGCGLDVRDESSEKKVKEVEGWDGYHVYHEVNHPKENSSSHFKENSINVPRQQPTPTRPFHIEEPQNLAAAARSPYANRSSCGNSQIGSASPSSNFDTDEEGDMPPAGDEFPMNESEELEEARIRPLMMRIQTKTVTTGILPDGRNVHVGDVVWGKIHGFPWWPGKILTITVSKRDNGTVITQMAHIAWCGSSTMSHMPCSELYPFLEDFKYRYNKKKKGTYKNAIKEATHIAQGMITSQTCIDTNGSPSVAESDHVGEDEPEG